MKAITRNKAELKDSGIKWIGKIPRHWNSKKVKYIANLYTGNSISDNEKDFFSDPIDAHPYIATKHIDIDDNSVNYENGLYVKDLDDSFKVALPNSTLMCIEGGSAGRKKALVNRTVSFVNKLCCFKATEKTMDKYLYYFLMSPNYEENFKMHITGLIGGVSVSELKNIPIVEPPCDERVLIANYLDDRCSKIDAIIAEAKASIEEYKELKQAVIYEAVTKGLDKNATMKDSGVEWIGQIPNYMTVKKIKYVTQISRGLFGYRPRNAAFLYDGPYPFIQTGDVARANHYITEYKQTLSEEGKKVSRLFPKGTLTMTIAANVGDVSILGFDAYFPDSVLGFIPYDKYSSEYLYYIFSSMKEEFVLNAISNTQLNLNVERVKELYIPVLEDVEQQKKLIDYLDSKTEKIDIMISEKQSLIEELEAYKKSLIYEVVTGKRKVVE